MTKGLGRREDSQRSCGGECRSDDGAGLTQSGRVDGLDGLLHLVQDAAVNIQSLNKDTKRQTETQHLGKELGGMVTDVCVCFCRGGESL